MSLHYGPLYRLDVQPPTSGTAFSWPVSTFGSSFYDNVLGSGSESQVAANTCESQLGCI